MRFISSLLACAGLALAAVVPIAAWAGPVDINTADAGTLARELNGIGPSRAQAIVAYRNQHGPFKSVDDLALVKNVPQKVIDSNREFLRVEGGRGTRGEGKPAPADARSDAQAVARADAKPASKAAPKP